MYLKDRLQNNIDNIFMLRTKSAGLPFSYATLIKSIVIKLYFYKVNSIDLYEIQLIYIEFDSPGLYSDDALNALSGSW